ncbi:histidinol-phosphate transaminase [Brevibacterium litoralis]|uniref:histidinol-phosphate transaminase n=1 Tax=Brevibacterium litoralis TaxID=3138935 RepID=UPI0032EBADA5
MTNLEDLPLRADLRGQTPYGAPQLDIPVRLNVNENAFDVPADVVQAMDHALQAELPHLNRYPDREFTALRARLARYLDGVLTRQGGRDAASGQPVAHAPVDPAGIWAANGSNEVLSHIVQAFGGPGRRALGFVPSYSMHSLITTSTGAEWITAERAADFTLTADAAVAAVRAHRPEVVFLCTPNNPTGTGLDLDVVRAVLAETEGIVVVDEAYAEFARPGYVSALTLLPDNPRLVVSRTMSKAFAFAGVRLGYAVADPALIDALRLVRLPYHLSALTQAAAGAALDHADSLLANVEELIRQRDRMSAGLADLGLDVVPSDSNFLLFGGLTDPSAFWQGLLDRGVLVRDIGIPGHLRVNAGTADETTAFLDACAALLAADPTHLTTSETAEESA